MIDFTVNIKPQPQGSSNAYVRGGRAIVTSANKNLKPFRDEIKRRAQFEIAAYHSCTWTTYFLKAVPVRLILEFEFVKPKSANKRVHMTVKPDCDKLVRGVCDALTGVIYVDDSQVVEIIARKRYGAVESVRIVAEEYKEEV
jgi:Holliday junction resolvase RusA-like endonuclease